MGCAVSSSVAVLSNQHDESILLETHQKRPRLFRPSPPEPHGHLICRFCGGKGCKHEDWTRQKGYPSACAIQGLNSTYVTERIIAMQRPSTRLIARYDIISQMHDKNIGAVFNLQIAGEHPICGDGIEEHSGFSYDPEALHAAGVIVYNLPWVDMDVPPLSLMLCISQLMDRHITNMQQTVCVHCHAGYGRTGLAIGGWLMYKRGLAPAAAISLVRERRPACIQTRAQVAYMFSYYAYLQLLRRVFKPELLRGPSPPAPTPASSPAGRATGGAAAHAAVTPSLTSSTASVTLITESSCDVLDTLTRATLTHAPPFLSTPLSTPLQCALARVPSIRASPNHPSSPASPQCVLEEVMPDTQSSVVILPPPSARSRSRPHSRHTCATPPTPSGISAVPAVSAAAIVAPGGPHTQGTASASFSVMSASGSHTHAAPPRAPPNPRHCLGAVSASSCAFPNSDASPSTAAMNGMAAAYTLTLPVALHAASLRASLRSATHSATHTGPSSLPPFAAAASLLSTATRAPGQWLSLAAHAAHARHTTLASALASDLSAPMDASQNVYNGQALLPTRVITAPQAAPAPAQPLPAFGRGVASATAGFCAELLLAAGPSGTALTHSPHTLSPSNLSPAPSQAAPPSGAQTPLPRHTPVMATSVAVESVPSVPCTPAVAPMRALTRAPTATHTPAYTHSSSATPLSPPLSSLPLPSLSLALTAQHPATPAPSVSTHTPAYAPRTPTATASLRPSTHASTHSSARQGAHPAVPVLSLPRPATRPAFSSPPPSARTPSSSAVLLTVLDTPTQRLADKARRASMRRLSRAASLVAGTSAATHIETPTHTSTPAHVNTPSRPASRGPALGPVSGSGSAHASSSPLPHNDRAITTAAVPESPAGAGYGYEYEWSEAMRVPALPRMCAPLDESSCEDEGRDDAYPASSCDDHRAVGSNGDRDTISGEPFTGSAELDARKSEPDATRVNVSADVRGVVYVPPSNAASLVVPPSPVATLHGSTTVASAGGAAVVVDVYKAKTDTVTACEAGVKMEVATQAVADIAVAGLVSQTNSDTDTQRGICAEVVCTEAEIKAVGVDIGADGETMLEGGSTEADSCDTAAGTNTAVSALAPTRCDPTSTRVSMPCNSASGALSPATDVIPSAPMRATLIATDTKPIAAYTVLTAADTPPATVTTTDVSSTSTPLATSVAIVASLAAAEAPPGAAEVSCVVSVAPLATVEALPTAIEAFSPVLEPTPEAEVVSSVSGPPSSLNTATFSSPTNPASTLSLAGSSASLLPSGPSPDASSASALDPFPAASSPLPPLPHCSLPDSSAASPPLSSDISLNPRTPLLSRARLVSPVPRLGSPVPRLSSPPPRVPSSLARMPPSLAALFPSLARTPLTALLSPPSLPPTQPYPRVQLRAPHATQIAVAAIIAYARARQGASTSAASAKAEARSAALAELTKTRQRVHAFVEEMEREGVLCDSVEGAAMTSGDVACGAAADDAACNDSRESIRLREMVPPPCPASAPAPAAAPALEPSPSSARVAERELATADALREPSPPIVAAGVVDGLTTGPLIPLDLGVRSVALPVHAASTGAVEVPSMAGTSPTLEVTGAMLEKLEQLEKLDQVVEAEEENAEKMAVDTMRFPTAVLEDGRVLGAEEELCVADALGALEELDRLREGFVEESGENYPAVAPAVMLTEEGEEIADIEEDEDTEEDAADTLMAVETELQLFKALERARHATLATLLAQQHELLHGEHAQRLRHCPAVVEAIVSALCHAATDTHAVAALEALQSHDAAPLEPAEDAHAWERGETSVAALAAPPRELRVNVQTSMGTMQTLVLTLTAPTAPATSLVDVWCGQFTAGAWAQQVAVRQYVSRTLTSPVDISRGEDPAPTSAALDGPPATSAASDMDVPTALPGLSSLPSLSALPTLQSVPSLPSTSSMDATDSFPSRTRDASRSSPRRLTLRPRGTSDAPRPAAGARVRTTSSPSTSRAASGTGALLGLGLSAERPVVARTSSRSVAEPGYRRPSPPARDASMPRLPRIVTASTGSTLSRARPGATSAHSSPVRVRRAPTHALTAASTSVFASAATQVLRPAPSPILSAIPGPLAAPPSAPSSILLHAPSPVRTRKPLLRLPFLSPKRTPARNTTTPAPRQVPTASMPAAPPARAPSPVAAVVPPAMSPCLQGAVESEHVFDAHTHSLANTCGGSPSRTTLPIAAASPVQPDGCPLPPRACSWSSASELFLSQLKQHVNEGQLDAIHACAAAPLRVVQVRGCAAAESATLLDVLLANEAARAQITADVPTITAQGEGNVEAALVAAAQRLLRRTLRGCSPRTLPPPWNALLRCSGCPCGCSCLCPPLPPPERSPPRLSRTRGAARDMASAVVTHARGAGVATVSTALPHERPNASAKTPLPALRVPDNSRAVVTHASAHTPSHTRTTAAKVRAPAPADSPRSQPRLSGSRSPIEPSSRCICVCPCLTHALPLYRQPIFRVPVLMGPTHLLALLCDFLDQLGAPLLSLPAGMEAAASLAFTRCWEAAHAAVALVASDPQPLTGPGNSRADSSLSPHGQGLPPTTGSRATCALSLPPALLDDLHLWWVSPCSVADLVPDNPSVWGTLRVLARLLHLLVRQVPLARLPPPTPATSTIANTPAAAAVSSTHTSYAAHAAPAAHAHAIHASVREGDVVALPLNTPGSVPVATLMLNGSPLARDTLPAFLPERLPSTVLVLEDGAASTHADFSTHSRHHGDCTEAPGRPRASPFTRPSALSSLAFARSQSAARLRWTHQRCYSLLFADVLLAARVTSVAVHTCTPASPSTLAADSISTHIPTSYSTSSSMSSASSAALPAPSRGSGLPLAPAPFSVPPTLPNTATTTALSAPPVSTTTTNATPVSAALVSAAPVSSPLVSAPSAPSPAQPAPPRRPEPLFSAAFKPSTAAQARDLLLHQQSSSQPSQQPQQQPLPNRTLTPPAVRAARAEALLAPSPADVSALHATAATLLPPPSPHQYRHCIATLLRLAYALTHAPILHPQGRLAPSASVMTSPASPASSTSPGSSDAASVDDVATKPVVVAEEVLRRPMLPLFDGMLAFSRSEHSMSTTDASLRSSSSSLCLDPLYDTPAAAYLRFVAPLLPASPVAVVGSWWLHWLLQLASSEEDSD